MTGTKNVQISEKNGIVPRLPVHCDSRYSGNIFGLKSSATTVYDSNKLLK